MDLLSSILGGDLTFDKIAPHLTKYMESEKIKTIIIRHQPDGTVETKNYTKDISEFHNEMKGALEAKELELSAIRKDAVDKLSELEQSNLNYNAEITSLKELLSSKEQLFVDSEKEKEKLQTVIDGLKSQLKNKKSNGTKRK